jgi:aldehyde:ferredoxin oxidoreductase
MEVSHMASGGYTGKILRVDLTAGKISTIDTARYKQWGGGHGMGSAIFWDLCQDKTVDGFDPKNMVTVMASPLSGSPAPAVAGRSEVQGIGVQGYPVGWFTRSGFGGRFSGMLKYAGWDGIVVEGKAASPVWIDVRNGDVQIRDAKGVWGLDTTEAQEEIWRRVQADDSGNWMNLGTTRDAGRTTQRSAVLTIGPVGENLSRTAALIHDSGNGAGQGGFGAVFGSKNLKAISVLGTGSVKLADPAGLMDARKWLSKWTLSGNIDNYKPAKPPKGMPLAAGPGSATLVYGPKQESGPQGCLGCIKSCRARWKSGKSNGSSCIDLAYYMPWDKKLNGAPTQTTLDMGDLAQRAGINVYELNAAIIWLVTLNKMGILGVGKQIPSSLPYEKVGTSEFATALINSIVQRTDIGADLTDGVARCAVKWGRYEQDTKSGICPLQYWGYSQHYDARTEVEWGYGSMLGERDVNEHDFNNLCYWLPSLAAMTGETPAVSAADMAAIMGEKLLPYKDPMMIDYSDEGIYSDAMAKLVAWHRHYGRYWKQSILFCDWAYADLFNVYGPNGRGASPEAEPKFLKAVTGEDITFEQGMEIGRKIWNLDRAIWFLQGRTRELEVLSEYSYETPAVPHAQANSAIPSFMPAFENGAWSYKNVTGRILDKAKVEEWKTKFYALEGWDTTTGAPTRKTLEAMGLGNVADTLEQAGKLGK